MADQLGGLFQQKRRGDDGEQIRGRIWWGKFRLDGDEKPTRISLRTTDKVVARRRLDAIMQEREREREGILSPRPMREAAAQKLSVHLDAFLGDLQAKQRSPEYRRKVRHRVRPVS